MRASSRESAFKIVVATYIGENSELQTGEPGVDEVNYVAELETLERATIGGITTTSCDSLTDQMCPELQLCVGQDELLLSPHAPKELPLGLQQIPIYSHAKYWRSEVPAALEHGSLEQGKASAIVKVLPGVLNRAPTPYS